LLRSLGSLRKASAATRAVAAVPLKLVNTVMLIPDLIHLPHAATQ
jgi:hypothetical protein